MKLKYLLLLIPGIFIMYIASAQIKNPYQSIGKKGKILTLTKGEYEEFFDQDIIQQIGTSLINIKTFKVIKLLEDKEGTSRLANEKNSRFLSVDPLRDKYPMLTPYQYASNRPIDGKDLDGLEYITYLVDVYQYSNGAAQQVINYKWFDDLQHNKCGELGQGVTYDIRVHTAGGAAYQLSPIFVARQDKVFGFIKADYGNYMGGTSLFDVNSHMNLNHPDSKIFTSKYNYDLPAVDHVDDLARKHDQAYDALDAVGRNSLENDWGTTPVDDQAREGWNSFLRDTWTGKNKGIDPMTKQPILNSEFDAANRASAAFSKIINNKLNDISDFMRKNYSKEASKDRESNYSLFLSKYMHQDKDGTWHRIDVLWTKQKNGVYTPNQPKK